jgi:hypothetical protein
MDVQKDIICHEIVHLEREAKIQIIKIIKQHDASKLTRLNDGTAVNLDKLPSEVINSIYTFIKHKLNLP